MSIGQMFLVATWLADGIFINRDLKTKLHTFISNPAALILASLFFIHILGLLFTVDFTYGWKDLRIKLPLLILPLIISSTPPLNQQRIKQLFYLYFASCLIGTLFAISKLIFNDISNIRDIVWFNSHIRFALNIVLSVFATSIYAFRSDNRVEKFGLFITALWFITYLILQESITGLGVLLSTTLVLILIFLFKKQKLWISLPTALLLIIIPLSAILYLHTIWDNMKAKTEVNYALLEQTSAQGNRYSHDTVNRSLENGHYVWLYVQDMELESSWNRISTLPFDSLDQRNQELRTTLIRYLTSKNLRKDSLGVAQLTPTDIRNIERGNANYKHAKKTSIQTRIEIIFWEYNRYKQYGEITGHSLTQRFEFWRASWFLIERNFWFGVGTGDMNLAFHQAYQQMDSSLDQKNWNRSHNQYLSIFTGLGIFGLLWFLFIIVWPAVLTGAYKDFLYLAFFFIFILSMLFEDTIETQAGVTFYAFFSSALIFMQRTKKKSDTNL